MSDIVAFRFFVPFLIVIWMVIPMIGVATDTRDVVQLAAREAARKASIVNDYQAVEQTALDTITGSGKPTSYNGVTLFDPTQDVDINFYDGSRCTVTIHYRAYLLSPNILSLIGGGTLGPTINLQEQATFERSW